MAPNWSPFINPSFKAEHFMNKSIAIKLIAISATIMPARVLFAHDGHGFEGSHWHASDVFGFALLAVAIGISLWFGRGGK
jgi:hypothetical protein